MYVCATYVLIRILWARLRRDTSTVTIQRSSDQHKQVHAQHMYIVSVFGNIDRLEAAAHFAFSYAAYLHFA